MTAIALAVVLVTRGPSAEQRRAEILDVSERFSLALADYDAADLDGEREEVLALATGSFEEDYEETFGSSELVEALQASGSKATARVVVGPLLAELDGDSARTFTVLEQTVEANDMEEPETRRLRMELVLLETREGWKVNAVQLT